MSQANVDLFLRMAEVFNSRQPDESLVEPLLDPEYRIENIVTAVTDKTYYGAAGCLEWFNDMAEAFAPGARYETEKIIADGDDFVVGRMAFVGTGARSGAPLRLRWDCCYVVSGREGSSQRGLCEPPRSPQSRGLVTRGGAKIVMAIGMTLIGTGVIWATQVPVHGHYLGNLLGPFAVAGAGTAFAFISISIAALAGIQEHQAGLASGLLNTSQNLGGAIGIAIASSVAATHTQALLHAGHAAPAALTGGFQHALWVLGAIALLALPVIFGLVRRNELSDAVAKTTSREPQPALAPAN